MKLKCVSIGQPPVKYIARVLFHNASSDVPPKAVQWDSDSWSS